MSEENPFWLTFWPSKSGEGVHSSSWDRVGRFQLLYPDNWVTCQFPAITEALSRRGNNFGLNLLLVSSRNIGRKSTHPRGTFCIRIIPFLAVEISKSLNFKNDISKNSTILSVFWTTFESCTGIKSGFFSNSVLKRMSWIPQKTWRQRSMVNPGSGLDTVSSINLDSYLSFPLKVLVMCNTPLLRRPNWIEW